jgi:hypothetical protein
MTAPSQPEKNPWAAALGGAFQTGWQNLVAGDAHDPLLDRLAAYADGRLPADEEAAVAREIAESPAAFEILAALVGDAERKRPLPSSEPSIAVPFVVRAAPEAKRERRRSSLAVWAAAASVLVAGWGLVRVRSLDGEVAALSRRAHESTSALVASETQRVASLNEGAMPYLAGANSAELAEGAMNALGATLVGQTRGRGELNDEQAAALAAAQERLASAAAMFDRTTIEGQLGYAAALVAAGQLDQAEAALADAEATAAQSPATLGQWENASATLTARRAAEAPFAQAGALWQQSEELYRSAAEHGYQGAWLNLALMLAEQGGRSGESLEAAQKYLESVSDPAVRERLEAALQQ